MNGLLSQALLWDGFVHAARGSDLGILSWVRVLGFSAVSWSNDLKARLWARTPVHTDFRRL